MIYRVYAMYDSKVKAYLRPFYQRADGEAMRAMINSSREEGSPLKEFGGDFTLFCIGEFDDSAGTIQMFPIKSNLGTALQIINQENANG